MFYACYDGRKRAEIIRWVKLCGASIVENAESIVGKETKLVGVTITIHLDFDFDNVPYINIDRDFVPEGL